MYDESVERDWLMCVMRVYKEIGSMGVMRVYKETGLCV